MLEKRRHALVILAAFLLLSAAVWATFGRATTAPFLFDDFNSIITNESIHRLWPLSVPFTPPTESSVAARPLVNFSLAVNYHFGELDPAGYRIFNMVVHAISAMLLFLIVRRTFKLWPLASQSAISDDLHATALAFSVALLWAVHPLQTEAVCYITQRTELMMGLFYLTTLLVSQNYWQVTSRAARSAWLTVAVAACLAGMTCKEVMASAPLVVLLYERTFVARSLRQALSESWPLYLGLCLTWIPLAYLNYDMPRHLSAGFHLGVPAVTWWLTQSKVLLMYLRLVFWPWPLAIHYSMPYLQSVGEALPWLLPVALLVAGTVFALWRGWAVGFLGAWFFVILSPTLLIPIITEVAAERRMYLSLAAVIVLVVIGGYLLIERVLPRLGRHDLRWAPISAITVIVAALALVAAGVSFQRLRAYRTELTIWEDTVATQPHSDLAQFNLAVALDKFDQTENAADHYVEAIRLNPNDPNSRKSYAKNLMKRDRHSEAVVQLKVALALQPDAADAHTLLGNALVGVGRIPEAVTHFQRALQLDPDCGDAHNNLGFTLLKSGRPKEAIEHFEQTLRLDPDFAEAHYNLGIALNQLGQLQDAIAHYREAVRLEPDSPEYRNNLGVALRHSGRPQEAIEHFKTAIEIKPDFADAHNSLGNTLVAINRIPEAIAQFEQALRLNPEYAEAHYNLGIALSRSGKLERAIRHYQEAVRLTPDVAEFHNNLGIALTTSGRLAEAIEQFHKAVTLNPDFADAYNNLGTALFRVGRTAAAIENFQQAVALRSDFADAHDNLGSALASMGRTPEAIEHFQEALRLDPTLGAVSLDLAMAYAQTGQRAEAVAMAQRALKWARSTGQTKLADEIEQWLREYRAAGSSSEGDSPNADGAPQTP